MSLIFATQLTAVATLALAFLALATAVLALMAWLKQSREVRDQAEMLKLQAEELRQVSADREREAVERRRAQAVRVYMWETPDISDEGEMVVSHVRNTSQQPVYEVVIHWLGDLGEPVWRPVPLMPDEEYAASVLAPPLDAGLPFASTVFFCDRAGLWWQTTPDGMLQEVRGYPPEDEGERSAETASDMGQ